MCWAHSSSDGELRQPTEANKCNSPLNESSRPLMRETLTGCNVPRDLVIWRHTVRQERHEQGPQAVSLINDMNKRPLSSIMLLEKHARVFMAVDGLTQQVPTCRRSLRKRVACHPNILYPLGVVSQTYPVPTCISGQLRDCCCCAAGSSSTAAVVTEAYTVKRS